MSEILSAALYRYQLPLSPHFEWANASGQQRCGAIVELLFDDGQCGWGEIAPLPGFSQESIDQAIDSARYHLRRLLDGEQTEPPEPSVAFAIDCAQQRIDFSTPPTQRAMLLQGQPAEVLDQLEGFPTLPRCIKLKVGRGPLQQEIKLLETLRAQMPVTDFRLDANQQWSLEQAMSFCSAVNMEQISFIEEPCADLTDTMALAARGFPVALDEHLQDPFFMPSAFTGLRALVIKPSLVGSLNRCLNLVGWANQHKVAVVVSACYESSLGTSQLATLAQQWSPRQIPGLDTLHYLQPHALPDGNAHSAQLARPSHWQEIWRS
jgi:O-succinylbenzoate synthase